VAGAGAAPAPPAVPAGGEAEPMDEDALLQQALAMSMQARATLLCCGSFASCGVQSPWCCVNCWIGPGCTTRTPLFSDGCMHGRTAELARPRSPRVRRVGGRHCPCACMDHSTKRTRSAFAPSEAIWGRRRLTRRVRVAKQRLPHMRPRLRPRQRMSQSPRPRLRRRTWRWATRWATRTRSCSARCRCPWRCGPGLTA